MRSAFFIELEHISAQVQNCLSADFTSKLLNSAMNILIRISIFFCGCLFIVMPYDQFSYCLFVGKLADSDSDRNNN